MDFDEYINNATNLKKLLAKYDVEQEDVHESELECMYQEYVDDVVHDEDVDDYDTWRDNWFDDNANELKNNFEGFNELLFATIYKDDLKTFKLLFKRVESKYINLSGYLTLDFDLNRDKNFLNAVPIGYRFKYCVFDPIQLIVENASLKILTFLINTDPKEYTGRFKLAIRRAIKD